jgi:hypothetical protein
MESQSLDGTCKGKECVTGAVLHFGPDSLSCCRLHFGCAETLKIGGCLKQTGEFMQIQFINHRRGSVIAFVLMGVIAVLVIVVVMLSRATRHNGASAPATAAETTGTLNEQAIPVATDLQSSETAAPVQLPPPPPPVSATPDNSNLPPEG